MKRAKPRPVSHHDDMIARYEEQLERCFERLVQVGYPSELRTYFRARYDRIGEVLYEHERVMEEPLIVPVIPASLLSHAEQWNRIRDLYHGEMLFTITPQMRVTATSVVPPGPYILGGIVRHRTPHRDRRIDRPITAEESEHEVERTRIGPAEPNWLTLEEVFALLLHYDLAVLTKVRDDRRPLLVRGSQVAESGVSIGVPRVDVSPHRVVLDVCEHPYVPFAHNDHWFSAGVVRTG